MSDEDMIRRGDAIVALKAAGLAFGYKHAVDVINAIPAVDTALIITALQARAEAAEAALAAERAKVAALVEAAKGLGRWCVKELPPHPDLTPLLESLDAAIEAARGE